MKRAAVGDLVTISPYDWRSTDTPLPDSPKYPAHYLRTVTTRGTGGGTVYRIRVMRRVIPRTRLPPGVKARYSIQAVKLGDYVDVELRDCDRVITLVWNERKRGRVRS